MSNIDSKIKSYYLSRKLTDEQLDIIKNTKIKSDRSHRSSNLSEILKYAAIFVLLVGTIYSIFLFPMYQKNALLNDYATEIAYNHRKNLPIEIISSDIEQIGAKMEKLNFTLEFPDSLQENYNLVGSRYCSVDNRIAAQLKLLGQNEQVATLFIFKKNKDLEFEIKTIVKNDVKVMLWESDDLIFALAK